MFKGQAFTATGTKISIDGEDCKIIEHFSGGVKCEAPPHVPGPAKVVVTYQDGNIFETQITYTHSSFAKLELFAGGLSSRGTTDGPNGKFNGPQFMVADSSGRLLFISDTYNHTIRIFDLNSKLVSTIAGAAGQSGSSDGVGPAARFKFPTGIAVSGNDLYVADNGNMTIRKINLSTAVVTTIAGQVGVAGETNGVGTQALFRNTMGLIVDPSNADIMYIADAGNGYIRKMVLSSATVSNFAGNGRVDENVPFCKWCSPANQLKNPVSMYIEGQDMYLVDGLEIMKISMLDSTQISSLVGAHSQTGFNNTAGNVLFNHPHGIVSDGTYLYVGDSMNKVIRKITIATNIVETFAGNGTNKSIDSTSLSDAQFSKPGPMVKIQNRIYIMDMESSQIRVLDLLSGSVATLTAGGAQ